MALPNTQVLNETDHHPHICPFIGRKDPVAHYPPVLVKAEMLGYLKDTSGIGYSRDIGRSVLFKGRVYYIFGDTFCKNEAGEFLGIQSNTYALVKNHSEPMDSTYFSTQEDGVVDALIPLSEAEHRKEKVHYGHGNDHRPRVTLWAFGGLAEVSDFGWIWYQKGVVYDEEGKEENTYKGTGLARVEEGEDDRLDICRSSGPMFTADEPRVGTFSTLVEGDFIYLWGDHGKDCEDGIILSRVPKDSPCDKGCYTYWNGESYVEDWQEAKLVFGEMQSGAIVKSCLFGEKLPYVFVGCSGWGDSQLLLGASAALEGPFDLHPIVQAIGIDNRDSIMYCMYPHTWAFEEREGELLVTWSEQWPGGVVEAGRGVMATKLEFQMDELPMFARIPISNYSKSIRSAILPALKAAFEGEGEGGITVALEGRYVVPGCECPDGELPLVVRLDVETKEQMERAVAVVEGELRAMRGAEGGLQGEKKKGRRGVGRLFRRSK